MKIFLTDEVDSHHDLQFFERITTIIYEYLKDDDIINKEVSILLTDDTTIHELNKQYRDKDMPTDVLSFEMIDDKILGDIVISVDTARVMADKYGLSLDNEITFLYIHGILHLIGYDHELSDEDEARMFQIQNEIFDIAKQSHNKLLS